MIAIVQRVTRGSVTVAGNIVGKIDHGMVVLLSIERDDGDAQIRWTADKLAHLRIFRSEDGEKHFDRDVLQIGGAILLISNFTVAASTRKGRRPTLEAAADPATGRALFDQLTVALKSHGAAVETGEFQADMQVELINDGPATFIVCTER